jgi:sugar lactone lactonase YvrE
MDFQRAGNGAGIIRGDTLCRKRENAPWQVPLPERVFVKTMNLPPAVLALALVAPLSATAETLWVATPFTAEKSFTHNVEGPACDKQGNVYAVNFAKDQTIGKVTPAGVGEVFVTLPGKSIGNGIRFNSQGQMFVADCDGHNVFKVDPATKAMSVCAHEASMTQPNDLAIAPDGTLFASDPDWDTATGRIWRVSTEGKVTLAASGLGTANGIEVSPDGHTLYFNESTKPKVWAYDIGADGKLDHKRLLKQFPDGSMDGMRCDVEGNLYIARPDKGTVIKMTPTGEVLHEVDVLGKSPTNLCFGGPDGRTVYVTEARKGRLVSFRVDQPGLEWKRGW